MTAPALIPDHRSSIRIALTAWAGTFVYFPLWDARVMLHGDPARWNALLPRVLRLAVAVVFALGIALALVARGGPLDFASLARSALLMATTWIFGGLLSAGFTALLAETRMRVYAASQVTALLLGGAALLSPAALGTVLLVILSARLGLFPVSGDRGLALVLPAFSAALLPAWLAGRAAADTWSGSPPGTDRLTQTALALCRAFTSMAGWILGATVVSEAIFAYPGSGQALLAGTGQLDVLLLLPLALSALRLHGIMLDLSPGAPIPPIRPAPTRPSHPVLITAAGLLVVTGALALWGSIAPPHDPASIDTTRLYEKASPEHRSGTDHLGRDVFSRMLQAQATALSGAVVGGGAALLVGSLWHMGAGALRHHGRAGALLAATLLTPAEALVIFAPAVVTLVLVAGLSQSVLLTAVLAGLVLSARVALAIDTSGTVRSARWGVAALAALMVAAFQVITLLGATGAGTPEAYATPGNLLLYGREWAASIPLLNDSRMLWRVLQIAGAAWLPGAALYALANVQILPSGEPSSRLTDFLG